MVCSTRLAPWSELDSRGSIHGRRFDVSNEEGLPGLVDIELLPSRHLAYLWENRKYFSPRRKGSRWSERNKALVARLIDERLMAPQGLEVIEHAKQDGTWDVVQDRSLPVERYAEFELLIGRSPKALENFGKVLKSTRQQFVGLYFDAKREATRVRSEKAQAR